MQVTERVIDAARGGGTPRRVIALIAPAHALGGSQEALRSPWTGREQYREGRGSCHGCRASGGAERGREPHSPASFRSAHREAGPSAVGVRPAETRPVPPGPSTVAARSPSPCTPRPATPFPGVVGV